MLAPPPPRPRSRPGQPPAAANSAADQARRTLDRPLRIEAERCVHQMLADAPCRACVDICPQRAWSMAEDGLGFDEARCDQCGLCVAACPREALQQAAPLPLVHEQGRTRTLLLACERAPLPAPDSATAIAAVLACLHSIGADWMLNACQDYQAQQLHLCSADCRTCERGSAAKQAGVEWQSRWQQLQSRLQQSRANALPQVRAIAPAQWQACQSDAQHLQNSGRRMFLRRIAHSPQALFTPSARIQHNSSGRRKAVAALLHALPPADPPCTARQLPAPLWAIQLAPERCNACLGCARICPEGAIELQDSSTQTAQNALTLAPHRCTGCTLCLALCDQAALQIESAPTPPPHLRQYTFPLQKQHCQHCGSAFYQLTQHSAQHEPTCIACQKGKPRLHNRLVQTDAAPASGDAT